MNFERCKKGLRSDRRGVSEVVGNILILMITVILFSAIVAYVNQIPVPEMTTKADFAATVSFETNGTTTASLTITHAGGVVLDAAETAVFIEAGTATHYYKLSEDADFPFSQWTTGSDWTKSIGVDSDSTEIIVTVIDLDKNSAVWTSQVSGGSGGSPPIILQRYVDSNNQSITADVIKEGDTFSFFVKVIDIDNDLDSSTSGVYLDSSALPSGGSEMDTYEASTSDGWFRFDFGLITGNASAIDGTLLKIHAWDQAGHETVSSYMVTVTVLPTDIDFYQINEPFEGGLPSYITWMNDGQGFGIYPERPANGMADIDNATTAFWKDEIIFIRVASLRLANIYSTNSLTMVDMRTGITYVPNYLNSSSAAEPFYPFSSSGGAFIFESTFSTEGLPPSAYSLTISLKSSGLTTAVFQVVKGITIGEEGSPISFMPEISVYKDDDFATEWGTKTAPFDLMSSDASHVYVKVHVQDATDSPSPIVDDIRIVDMRGDTQLHGTPPSGDMISPWEANDTEPVYEFWIDLRLNNGDNWIGGTNAYTLKISRFSDDNEGVYSLSTMIYVRTSSAKADFFVGAAGYMTGTTNFVNPQYLYYIENNNFFTKRSLYDYSNAPSAADNYAVSALALGDLDGDGDKDLLMGQYKSYNLYYLENSLNTFGAWQEASEITRPATDDLESEIIGIACGDTNGDRDIDFAYCTNANTLVIYNNTYGATGTLWKDYGSADVSKIVLEDVTGDGRADLIVLAGGRIYIYDMAEWNPDSVLAYIPDESSPTAIKDFDIADVNLDGYPDIVTTDITLNGAKVWYYEPAETPSAKRLATPQDLIPDAGEVLLYNVDATRTLYGNALQIGESDTADPKWALRLDMMTEELYTDPYQQLTVRAMVSADGGTPAEGFNIWYSVDDSVYTPLIYVPASQTTMANFTAPLPPTVAGKTLYIRVTDSKNITDTTGVTEILHIDYLAIITDTFGGYVSEAIFDTTPNSEKHDCIRIGNIDGTSDGYLEVILARDNEPGPPTSRIGEWQVYKRAGANDWDPLAGWYDSSTTFFPRGDDEIYLFSTMAQDAVPIENILSQASPRLFQVEDVNGDGYSDIIVVNTTISEGVTSQVALYLNMNTFEESAWWYYVVKDITADFNIADVRGGMTCLLVDNLVAT